LAAVALAAASPAATAADGNCEPSGSKVVCTFDTPGTSSWTVPNGVTQATFDGSRRPFPNEAWSTAPDEDGVGLSAVIGVQSDRRSVVWIMDMGGGELPPKLVGWDTRRDELHLIITIPPHAGRPGSLQQDLAIDEVRGAIFIADLNEHGTLLGTSDPAIVAVDLKTGRVRRALHGHPSLQPERTSPSRSRGVRYVLRTRKERWRNRSWA
jgi:hypothetical protein